MLFVYWILLISTPVAIGFGTIMVGKISQAAKIDTCFLPWWSSLLCFIVNTMFVLSQPTGKLPTSAYYWLLTFLLAGFVNVSAWVSNIIGYRYDKVSKVSAIFYIESVICLCLDVLAFD